jgi:4-amino-4-deoxy-L-arabinose transferase-like glycosyltransferase
MILWMTLKISESKDWRLWSTYGLIGGLALLTNPALGIALPFLLGWAAWRRKKAGDLRSVLPILPIALMALCCLPWIVRNYVQFERLVPMRSSLPFELWIGNNDIFDEDAISGVQRITRFEETRTYAQMGENAFLDDKERRANVFIRSKPVLFLRLTERRIIATWIGTEHPVKDFLRADSALIKLVLICNLILSAGTVAGVVQALRIKSGFLFPLLVFPVFYPLVYYITHTSLRYRHPIDPILIALTVCVTAAVFRNGVSSEARAGL